MKENFLSYPVIFVFCCPSPPLLSYNCFYAPRSIVRNRQYSIVTIHLSPDDPYLFRADVVGNGHHMDGMTIMHIGNQGRIYTHKICPLPCIYKISPGPEVHIHTMKTTCTCKSINIYSSGDYLQAAYLGVIKVNGI